MRGAALPGLVPGLTPALALALLLGACAASGTAAAGVGRPAPAFTSTDLDGHPVRLADFAGKRVLLNFWASWCVPCRKEFPVLRAAVAAHPDDLRVLGVVFNDGTTPAAEFVRQQHATWPSVVDPRHQVADAYGVGAKPGIPVTVLIDGRGVVRTRHIGPLTDAADVDRLLAGAK